MNIAICDDNQEYINILEKYILDKNEPEVSCDAFYSGEELVKMYNMGEGNYDVIFLDMEMNILNGIETANIIRKMDKHVIIVFVTTRMFKMTCVAIWSMTPIQIKNPNLSGALFPIK